MKQEKILTVEQKERKDRLRLRLFVLLILFNLLLVGYLAYEIISTFSSVSSNPPQVDLLNIANLFK